MPVTFKPVRTLEQQGAKVYPGADGSKVTLRPMQGTGAKVTIVGPAKPLGEQPAAELAPTAPKRKRTAKKKAATRKRKA